MRTNFFNMLFFLSRPPRNSSGIVLDSRARLDRLVARFCCAASVASAAAVHNCCAASVASKQQHKQDLRKIYRRGDEFSNWSLFTRMHCILPDCTAPLLTRVHCATKNSRIWRRMSHHRAVVPLRVDFSGGVLLWFTCKTKVSKR